MKRLLAIAAIISLILTSSAIASPNEKDLHVRKLRLPANTTATIKTPVYDRTALVFLDVWANGRLLRQAFTDGELTITIRGHKAQATMECTKQTGRCRIEIANFRNRTVRLRIRTWNANVQQ